MQPDRPCGPVRDATPANLRALVPRVGKNRVVERDTSASARPALVACLVVLAYVAGAAALRIGQETGATAAWFPAVGVGVHRAPGGAASALDGDAGRPDGRLRARELHCRHRSIGVSILLGLADSVEVALVGWLVMRFLGGRLRDVNDVWRLFGIATVGAVVGGVLVSLTYAATIEGSSFRTTLGLVVPSHGASVMLLAPLAMLSHKSWSRAWTQRRVELVAQCLTLATATLLTLAPGHLTLGFAPLPVLVWAAVRFSPWVVVIEQIIFAVAISLLTQLGGGPFADIVNTSAAASSTRYAQLYIICVVLIGLPLAIAMEQRERAVARLITSERMFRRNFTESRIPIALLVFEQDEARIGDCNQATAVLLHRSVDELVGRPVAALLESTELLDAVAAMSGGDADGVDRPRGRGRPAAHEVGDDLVAARERRGARVVLPAHGRRHRAPRAAGATPGRTRLHPVGDRHREQHDRGDRRRRHDHRGQPGAHRPHRLHRGRARRTPLLGEAHHRGAARAGLPDLR